MTASDVRRVDWRDVLPWLILVRVPRVARSLHLMCMGWLAVCLTLWGWYCLGAGLLDRDADLGGNLRLKSLHARQSVLPQGVVATDFSEGSHVWNDLIWHRNPILQVLRRMVEPVWLVFSDRDNLSHRGIAYCVLGTLWNLLVWAITASVICRGAVTELACEQRVGLFEALQYVRARWIALYLAPGIPLAGICFFTALLAIAGGLLRFDLGVALLGPLWFAVLLLALLMAILAVGLAAGWPLLWCALAAEGRDAFDALSRTYSYTFQHPLRYLGYVTVAMFVAGLAGAFASTFAEFVIGLARWSVAWGAGMDALLRIGPSAEAGVSGLVRFGATCITGFDWLVRSLAGGFAFSLFWCAATGIYLLLRKDTDNVELDQVYWSETAPLPITDPSGSALSTDVSEGSADDHA